MPYSPTVMLVVKELNGGIYLAQVAQATSDSVPGLVRDGTWHYVGDGTRPSVQEYSQTQFILCFEYLSHLVTRIVDITTWPPTQVQPFTLPGHPLSPSDPTFTYSIAPSAGMPHDAVALALQGSNSEGAVAAYYNPVKLTVTDLVENPFTNSFSVTIIPANGWLPESTSLTPFYRVYRRPLSGGSWSLVMDWNTILDFTDTIVGATFQYQYTATWGSGFDPAHPSDATKHAEGIVADLYATILSYDSETQSFDLLATPSDSISVPLTIHAAAIYVEPQQQFLIEALFDEISLSKANLEASTLAVPTIIDTEFPSFGVAVGSDEIEVAVGLGKVQSCAAPAALFT